MIFDAAAIDLNHAAFTPQVVIVEPAESGDSSSTAPQRPTIRKWRPAPRKPSPTSDATLVAKEQLDEFTREIMRAFTDKDVKSLSEPFAADFLFDKEEQTAAAIYRIRTRIGDLREISEEEEIILNEDSERDLWRFIRRLSFIKSPKLFLLDSGNLRAVWKGTAGQQVGLQFLGKGQIQFVIFSKRENADRISRVRGRDDFDGITRHMDASNSSELVYA